MGLEKESEVINFVKLNISLTILYCGLHEKVLILALTLMLLLYATTRELDTVLCEIFTVPLVLVVWNECSISKNLTALTYVLQSTSPEAIC